jgi:hypothetical protein
VAIALDNNLGSNNVGAVTSFSVTTTATAAANTFIVFMLSYFHAGALSTVVSDPGGSYTMDKRTSNGSDFFEIFSRQAVAGLASGSVISITWGGGSAGGFLGGAASFTGVATSGALVTSGSGTGSGASWSSGAATNTGQADALFIGGAGNEDPTAGTSSTATSGTEIHDAYNATAQQGFATGFKVVSTVASDSITGTFSNVNSTANTGALAIYAAAAGATASPYIRTFNAIPFIGGGL